MDTIKLGMTREKAIEYNKNLREYMRITDKESEYKFLKENYEALDFAIKALEQELSNSEIPNKSEIPTGSDDCISRERALDLLCKKCPVYDCTRKCISYKAIEKMPPSIPIRPKGHWQKIELPSRDTHECSECCGLALWDENNEQLTDFCPNCGADMREVEE